MSHFSLDPEPDLSVWVPCLQPSDIDSGEMPLAEWVETMATSFWAGDDDSPDPVDLERIRRLLAHLGDQEYPSWDPWWQVKWLHCPSPGDIPLAVCLSDIPAQDGGSEEELRSWLRVGDPAVVEEPIVQEIVTPLGRGLRALAYHRVPVPVEGEGDGVVDELWATLSYVWRSEDHDVTPEPAVSIIRLSTAWEIGRVIQAEDDIEALAQTLRVVPGDQAVDGGSP